MCATSMQGFAEHMARTAAYGRQGDTAGDRWSENFLTQKMGITPPAGGGTVLGSQPKRYAQGRNANSNRPLGGAPTILTAGVPASATQRNNLLGQ